MNVRCGLALGLLLLCSTAARADDLPAVVLPGESAPTGKRLAEARQLFAKRKWGESITLLQTVIDTSANQLVPLDARRSVRARRLAHVQLARMPPGLRETYRRRAEPQARRWLAEGIAGRDPALLARVVDEAFCTRSAEAALNLLGDLAFERGNFDEAEGWWRQITPLYPPLKKGGAGTDSLTHPAPQSDLARVRAKMLLARLFRAPPGRLPPGWGLDLQAFRARDGKASGALAGSKGAYADVVATLAEKRKKLPPPTGADWPTFGGDATRGKVLPGPPRLLDRLSQLCRTGPTWRLDLATRTPRDSPLRLGKLDTPIQRARGLAFHPVVVGHHVLVADARYVTAIDLRTGKAEEWYDVMKFTGGTSPKLELPAEADLRYTLTVAEGCVLARLGTQRVRDVRPTEKKDPDRDSFLVCLNLAPGPGGRRERWRVKAIDPARKDYSVFEGAPVAANGRAYIAATRFEGDKAITAIHCYPLGPEDSVPALLWRTEVCETREALPARAGAPPYRVRHHLLTLAGSQVVYCSHSGAVIALDAATGKRDWALRYPRRDSREPEDDPELRDLAPPLFAGGRLYVAPNDSDWLMCLAPDTGRIIWERRGLDVVHLLGVGAGRLIFTTWRNPGTGRAHAGGLRAVGASDGSDARGWALPDDGGGLIPMGRGLLVGNLVLWPTARKPYGVFAVRQVDGRQADNPSLLHRLPAGNLVFANGCLVVAGRRSLALFVPPTLLLEEAEEAARAAPDSPRAQLALADAEAERGLLDRARASYERALKKAGPGAKQVRQQALLRRQALLLQEAGSALCAKHVEEAEAALKGAAEGPPPARLRALVEGALLWEEAGEAKRARAVWQAIADDRELAELMIEEEGLPRRAGAVGTRRAQEPPARRASEGTKVPSLARRAGVELSLPLLRRWEAALAPGEAPLAAADALWTARGPALCARDLAGGKVKWTCDLPFVPQWAAAQNNTILAGGAAGIAAVSRDGKRLWAFHAPPLSRYPASPSPLRVVLDPLPPEPLADFHLAADRVFCVQGQRRLLALDAATGEVVWQRWAPGAEFRSPYPRGRFTSPLHVRASTLLVQASGRLWSLDIETGELRHDTPTSPEPWPRPPLPFGDKGTCVVPDERHVALLEEGKQLWAHTLPGATTRSGEPPLVIAGEALLVVLPENIGYRLQRLDRASGKPLWRQSPLLDLDRLDSAGWALDGAAVFISTEAGVEARSLSDGKVLWQRTQLGGPWRLRRAGDYLLAWPARAPALRFQFRWPRGSLQWVSGPLPPPGGAGLPLLCLDAKTGQFVERLNFAPGPANEFVEAHRARGGTWAWLGRDPLGWPGPDVFLTPSALVVAAGRRAWGLAAPPPVR